MRYGSFGSRIVKTEQQAADQGRFPSAGRSDDRRLSGPVRNGERYALEDLGACGSYPEAVTSPNSTRPAVTSRSRARLGHPRLSGTSASTIQQPEHRIHIGRPIV